MWAGVSGAKRELTAFPVGIGGTVREMASLHCGVDGAVRELWSAGPPLDPVLANNSWESIAYASEKGIASGLWNVGDEKNIALTTGETLTLVICGFDHDDLADGSGKAGITFSTKNLMNDLRSVNSAATNSGGYMGSALYQWFQNTLIPSLPSDLRMVIKEVSKKTTAGNGSTAVVINPMSVFPFSYTEISGVNENEGTIYPYFTVESNRIKYRSGIKWGWWSRSPYYPNRTSFFLVNSNASVGFLEANAQAAICFGFCV